jgi:hypothetical protein
VGVDTSIGDKKDLMNPIVAHEQKHLHGIAARAGSFAVSVRIFYKPAFIRSGRHFDIVCGWFLAWI